MRYNAAATYSMPWDLNRYTSRFSASYVTGSHAIKAGVQLKKSTADRIVVANAGEVSYTFNTPTPNSLPTTVSITEYATPYNNHERVKADMGIYAQDQWTIRRLTLNYGVRFDYFNAVHSRAAHSGHAVGPGPHLRRQSLMFRTGRTGARVSAARTTCSATARPRSR